MTAPRRVVDSHLRSTYEWIPKITDNFTSILGKPYEVKMFKGVTLDTESN